MDEVKSKKRNWVNAFQTAVIALIVCILFHVFLFCCGQVGRYIQDFREFNQFRYDRHDEGPAPRPFDDRRKNNRESLDELIARILPPNAKADQVKLIAAALNVIANRLDDGKIKGKADTIAEINRRIKGKADQEWVDFFNSVKERADADGVEDSADIADFMRLTADALVRASRTLRIDNEIFGDSEEEQQNEGQNLDE